MMSRLALPSRRVALVCLLVAFGGATTFACYEGNAPVRAGYGDLQFGTTSASPAGGTQTVVRLDLFLTSPFDQWDFRGQQLIGNPVGGTSATFDLPQTTLDPAANPFSSLFVQYSNNHAFWQTLVGRDRALARELSNQHEVDLGARDFEEQYAMFSTIVTTRAPESAGWVVAVDPNSGELPAAAVLAYPPQRDWQYVASSPTSTIQLASGGRMLTHTPILPGDFWSPGVTPGAPASLPLVSPPDPLFPVGAGSVKAARVVNRGLCAKFLPYVTHDPANLGLFEQLDPFFFPTLEKSTYEGQTCAQFTRRFTHYVSFLRSPTLRDSEPPGGFFFYWAAHLEGVGFLGENVEVARNDSFAWTLLDGRLSVVPERHFAVADGTGFLGVSGDPVETHLETQLLTALTVPPPPGQITTLPEGIWQTANDLQAFPTSKSSGAKEQCTQPVPPANTPPIETIDATSAMCGLTVKTLRDALTNATNLANPNSALSVLNGFLGGGVTANDVSAITNAVFQQDVDPISGTHTWHNFRCHADIGQTQALCQFVFRAKRVNAYPDGVEVVFLDDPYDFTNPTYGAWLAAWDGATNADGRAALANLCDPPTAQSPIGSVTNRAFSHLDFGANTFQCYCPTASVYPNTTDAVFTDCCTTGNGFCRLVCDASQALCGDHCCDVGKTCLDPTGSTTVGTYGTCSP